MSSRRVVLAVVLGFCAFFVANVSDVMLRAARSPSPPLSFVIMGAYLALCQFLVAKKGVEPRELGHAPGNGGTPGPDDLRRDRRIRAP